MMSIKLCMPEGLTTKREPDSLTIVHVVRQFRPAIGGLENFVEQLALQQVAADHRVKVVTLNRVFDGPANQTLARTEEYRGITIRRLRFVGSRRYPVAPGILTAIQGADLVHVHGLDFFADFLAASAWIHGRPMVLTTHGGFFHTSFARRLKEIYFQTVTRLSLSQFGAVIACSDEDARLFGRITLSRLRLIPNPVDIDKFAGLGDRSSRMMIYFGRLAPNKELERLIAWFAGLAETDYRWRLIIAGKPMGTSVSGLWAAAASEKVQERIEIHERPTDDELKRLIAMSAVYCCASSYEGFGLAAIEAVSAGLYPVLSEIAPFRSSIGRLGYGSMVNFADVSTWPNSYQNLQRSLDAFWREHDDGSIRHAVEPFAWPQAMGEFDQVYRQVLGRDSRKIVNVEVAVLDQAEAVSLIVDAVRERRPKLVAFCNAHTANLASRDVRLRRALGDALVLNDGVGVDLAGRLLFGSEFPANLNGTDFIPHLIASSDQPLRLFLLGSEPGVAEKAADRLATKNSSVEVVGVMHGYFDDRESPRIRDSIKRSGANMVLVAMGQPRQELWAAQNFREFAGPTICVGALFDFLAEAVPRAPLAIRRVRLEWAYRLIQEPARLWRRYLVGNAAFMWRILVQKLAGTRI